MKKYSYKEAVDFFKNLPHFVPPASSLSKKRASDLFSLDAELALLQKVGEPHMDLKYVHVAGTNGKGSTSAFIASILKEANYKVGCFTSPFLYSYNEMFKVNGEDISDEDFARVFSEVRPCYDELSAAGIYPSEYEILTVMAFLYFKEMACDIVVLEVSMGGKVDTTNVIPAPLVTVITPISFDHMSILGDTLAEIATEKAGIIKAGTVVVSARQEREVCTVLEDTCLKVGAEISYEEKPKLLGRDLSGQIFESYGAKLETSLLGTYQVDNAALAVLAALKLKNSGFNISDRALKDGVRATKWFGRFTLLKNTPPVIIDGGHNRQGASVLADSLKEYFPDKKITFVLGILKDKEVDVMLSALLPLAKEVYTVAVPSARTMSPEELAELINAKGIAAHSVHGQVDLGKIVAGAEVVCIAGSLYLIQSIVDAQ